MGQLVFPASLLASELQKNMYSFIYFPDCDMNSSGTCQFIYINAQWRKWNRNWSGFH